MHMEAEVTSIMTFYTKRAAPSSVQQQMHGLASILSRSSVFQDDKQERKLSKQQLAAKLRSGQQSLTS